jgi:hypothetical protein
MYMNSLYALPSSSNTSTYHLSSFLQKKEHEKAMWSGPAPPLLFRLKNPLRASHGVFSPPFFPYINMLHRKSEPTQKERHKVCMERNLPFASPQCPSPKHCGDEPNSRHTCGGDGVYNTLLPPRLFSSFSQHFLKRRITCCYVCARPARVIQEENERLIWRVAGGCGLNILCMSFNTLRVCHDEYC